MTGLVITADTVKKRLRFTGDEIAAGEHVGVKVAGFGGEIGDGRKLRLRVVSCNRLVAIFPHIQTDAWEEDGDGNAVCELNLNSIELQRETRCGGQEFRFILDDVTVPQLYGSGMRFIGEWRKEPGADVPYCLDGYPDIIREFGERLDGFGDEVTAAKDAAQAAKDEATDAKNAAKSAAQSAASQSAALTAFKAKFDFSTISELTDADSIRAVKNAFNNLLQKLKAVNQ